MITNVEVIRSGLEAIYKDRGRLVPAEIVEVASEKTHPLHRFFEWDDSEAGRLYRNAQAAGLVRSVKIRVTSEHAGDVTDFKIRAWLPAAATKTNDGDGYIPEAEIRDDPVRRSLTLQQMRRDWGVFRRRYEHLCEFWSLVADQDLAS